MTFTDTHCHIHEERYKDAIGALKRAQDSGVERLICVGTDETTSAEAVAFSSQHENVWTSIGVHPHEAASSSNLLSTLNLLLSTTPKGRIIAIGECGLDYFYTHSPKEKQIEMLHAQLELARKHDLPVIFHVRNGQYVDQRAFDDFWPIFDSYSGLRGVLHSFTDNQSNLEKGLSRGLYVGINGISTFTKDDKQRALYATIPVDRILLETDSPYLTPVPMRGTVNEPAFLTHIAQYIANLQSIPLEELSRVTERNATHLFQIKTTK